MILDSDLPELPAKDILIEYQSNTHKVHMSLNLAKFVPQTTMEEWERFLRKTLRECQKYGDPEPVDELRFWLMLAVDTTHKWADEANRQLDEQLIDLDHLTPKTGVYTRARKQNQLLLDRQHSVVKLKHCIESRKDLFTKMFGGT